MNKALKSPSSFTNTFDPWLLRFKVKEWKLMVSWLIHANFWGACSSRTPEDSLLSSILWWAVSRQDQGVWVALANWEQQRNKLIASGLVGFLAIAVRKYRRSRSFIVMPLLCIVYWELVRSISRYEPRLSSVWSVIFSDSLVLSDRDQHLNPTKSYSRLKSFYRTWWPISE